MTVGDRGSDTIIGSGSRDTVFLEDQHFGNTAISTSRSGTTTVSFADSGQHFRISGVQTLTFAHGHVVHL
jgi:hypothetical protein